MRPYLNGGVGLAAAVVLALGACAAGGRAMAQNVPENLYRGELVTYPGPWAFTLGREHIILVSDAQLEALADPDQKVNLTLTREPREESLREICERAQARDVRTLIIAFDHFFAQYRPGQEGKPRRLMPDTDEYIERMAAISKFCAQYGVALELSVLSPLEIGPGYVRDTGQPGVWMHYRKGLRDPNSGAYSVQLWRQRVWSNNKGPLELKDAGVRVFAFRERPINGTRYRVVRPEDIVDISDTAQVEVWDNAKSHHGDYDAVRVRIHGSGGGAEGMDRILVVQIYETPEMDYFSDKALPYLTHLVDRYADAGVKFNALYSDEMHIQQDWGYFNHHDNGELAVRYVSPGLASRYADTYGEPFRDFAKYLIYFCYGQEDTANDLSAKAGVMHVWGDTPEDIAATALFRARYYHMLQDGVVDLFAKAKQHLEERMGYRLLSRAHATWAESPTVDRWDVGQGHHARHQYEYTSNFVWSDTVHQAASACYDYFRWGDFLTGNGNDHAEGGWLDRNYLGLALACSTGIINEIPYSYGAHWGMPHEVSQRRSALVNAYGAAAWGPYAMVQDMEHRDVEVLLLYPLDLVAAEERFGSWMTQYGYANLISAAKLLELGAVSDGAVELCGRRFTTLVALFEPFPSEQLLAMMEQLAAGGGKMIWSGPPPLRTLEGTPALAQWQELTGVAYTPRQTVGVLAPGKEVVFEGPLADVPPMTILTDFIVDRIYPVVPGADAVPTARVKGDVVGAQRATAKGGSVTYLGFRPRDDQSGSLGYEERHWFEMLDTLGAYPPSGIFPGVNDNPQYLSRTTDYLVCSFPNGAVAVAPHMYAIEEAWPGGFARNREEDQRILEQIELTPDAVTLNGFHMAGHTVDYQGQGCLTFRVNPNGTLIAFSGAGADRITVDGKTTVFAAAPMPLVAWAPIQEHRRVDGGAVMQIRVHGTGEVRIPAQELPAEVMVVAEGPAPGSRGDVIKSQIKDGELILEIEPNGSNRWLYVAPAL
jgi:hypothetical protein